MVGNCSFATNDDVVALGFSKVLVPIWCRFYHSPARTAVIWSDYLIYLKSATKLFSVLLASKRPLITELADKLRLKYPLLPTISPCPPMRLEAIRSIIPISCRRYPKSV